MAPETFVLGQLAGVGTTRVHLGRLRRQRPPGRPRPTLPAPWRGFGCDQSAKLSNVASGSLRRARNSSQKPLGFSSSRTPSQLPSPHGGPRPRSTEARRPRAPTRRGRPGPRRRPTPHLEGTAPAHRATTGEKQQKGWGQQFSRPPHLHLEVVWHLPASRRALCSVATATRTIPTAGTVRVARRVVDADCTGGIVGT